MDKLIEKLIGILTKLGMSEDQVNEVVAELSATETEENPAPASDPVEDAPSEGDVPPADVPPAEDGNGEPPSGEPAPGDVPSDANEGEPVVPPSEGEVPPSEGDPVAPAEPEVPAVPPFDPAPLLAEMDEMRKANEGLLSRIAALEEALKNAGVIDGSTPSTNEVGDPLPAAAPQSPTDDVLGDVMRKLNSGKKF